MPVNKNHIIRQNKKYAIELESLLAKKERIDGLLRELYAEINYLDVRVKELVKYNKELLEVEKEAFVFRETIGIYKENESNN